MISFNKIVENGVRYGERYDGLRYELAVNADGAGITLGAFRTTIPGLNNALTNDIHLIAPELNIPTETRERAALFSLEYAGAFANLLAHPQQAAALIAMFSAIIAGDRAEAWYQLRYGLNNAASHSVAREHFDEAQVFGLFQNANPYSGDALGDAESLLAFRMATLHQTTIGAYESLYAADLATAQLNIAVLEAATHLDYGSVSTLHDALAPAMARLTHEYTDVACLAPDLVANLGGDSALLAPAIGAVWVAPDVAGDQGAAHGVTRTGNVNDLIFGSITIGGQSSDVADTLSGGNGNDFIIGGKGADAIDGGAGEDTLSFLASTRAVTADLGKGTGSAGDAAGDTYSHIENFLGTQYDDKLVGNGGHNILYGAAGNDVMAGGGGSDLLVGGTGDDAISGDGLNKKDKIGGAHLTPVAQADLVHGNTLVGELGGAAGYGEFSLAPNDDGSSEAIDITAIFGVTGLNFFGANYTQLFVNNNGNLTFNGGLSTFTPGLISAGTDNPIIAAFWADVDTRNHEGTNDLVYYDLDTTNGVFTATWYQVGFYNSHPSPYDSFQIQLISEGHGDFDIVLRFEAVGWTTGDASEGAAARAGYSSGNGVNYFELSESGNDAAMRALPDTAGNTGIDGLFVFHVVNGVILDASDTIDGGAGADTLTGGPGADAFVFRAGEANGDTVTDFTAANGDKLYFLGYGEDATFAQLDATHWQIGSDILTFSNSAMIHPGDVIIG